jgi:hypothetical protein
MIFELAYLRRFSQLLCEQTKSYLEENDDSDWAESYCKLLVLVKTMSKEDDVWISFVEGLNQHTVIVMFLMCSGFDLVCNYIEQGFLKKKDFKQAGVPHFKSPVVTLLEHLNEILEGRFEALMLTTPFLVQALFTKQNKSQIDKTMIALKEHSE